MADSRGGTEVVHRSARDVVLRERVVVQRQEHPRVARGDGTMRPDTAGEVAKRRQAGGKTKTEREREGVARNREQGGSRQEGGGRGR
eukprot:3540255-Rhodomonas_salina.1